MSRDIDNIRPAFRDLMSFCFQPQNVVANANILFYRTDKTEHRNKLINIFPYVLGAITPKVLSARQELVDLQRKLNRKEHDSEKLCELTIRWENEINAWVSVAIELCLLNEDVRNMTFESKLVYLQELVKENTEEKVLKSDNIIRNSEELVILREKENELAMNLTKLKNRYVEMSQLMKSVSEYRDALSIQVERLSITEWLNEKAKKGAHLSCMSTEGSDDTQRNIYLHRLEENRNKRNKMDQVPAAFEREYKTVKNQIQGLTDELVSIQKRIRIEENRVNNYNEKDTINPSRYTLDGISRFLGKIEYASEAIASLEADGELLKEISTIRAKIDELKKIADESVIKRKIENAITKISVKQMELLKLMDVERPDDPFKLDYKNLTVEVDGKDGRKDYLWEIGSGSNWLAYHISTILGLQEFFSTFQSSVPNFVVFDQPSQVYFPQGYADDKLLKDLDRNAVRSIFLTMAKSVSNVDNNMQILVLEHADDSIYGDIQGVNEVCIWRNGEKLIPLEWIQN